MKRWMGGIMPAHPDQNRQIVLLYHAVGDGPWAVSVEKFHAQLEYIQKYAVCEELTNAGTGYEGLFRVTITFDDGYGSLLDRAAPLLADLGLTAKVYLSTAHIGRTIRQRSVPELGHYPNESFLTWPDVKELLALGWTVGSHGHQHLNYTKQDPSLVSRELSMSKEIIEQNLGIECADFAFPYGAYDDSLLQQVRDAGYSTSVTGIHGAIKDEGAYEIPRVDIAAAYSLDDFKAILAGKWDFLGYHQKIRRWFQ